MRPARARHAGHPCGACRRHLRIAAGVLALPLLALPLLALPLLALPLLALPRWLVLVAPVIGYGCAWPGSRPSGGWGRSCGGMG